MRVSRCISWTHMPTARLRPEKLLMFSTQCRRLLSFGLEFRVLPCRSNLSPLLVHLLLVRDAGEDSQVLGLKQATRSSGSCHRALPQAALSLDRLRGHVAARGCNCLSPVTFVTMMQSTQDDPAYRRRKAHFLEFLDDGPSIERRQQLAKILLASRHLPRLIQESTTVEQERFVDTADRVRRRSGPLSAVFPQQSFFP